MLLSAPAAHCQTDAETELPRVTPLEVVEDDAARPPAGTIQRWLLPRGATDLAESSAQPIRLPAKSLLEVQIKVYPEVTCHEVEQRAALAARANRSYMTPMTAEQLAGYGDPVIQRTVLIATIAPFTLPQTAYFDSLEVPVGPLWLSSALRRAGKNTTVVFDADKACPGSQQPLTTTTVIPEKILQNGVNKLSIAADRPFSARIVRVEPLSIGVGEVDEKRSSLGYGYDPSEGSTYTPRADWQPVIRTVHFNNKEVLTQRSPRISEQQQQRLTEDPAVTEARELQNMRYQRAEPAPRQRSSESQLLLGLLAFFGSILAAPLALMIILAVNKRLLIRLLFAFQRWRCTLLSTGFPLAILTMLLLSPLLAGLGPLLGIQVPSFLLSTLTLLFGLLATGAALISFKTLAEQRNKTSRYHLPLEIIIPVGIVFMLPALSLAQSMVALATLSLVPLLSVSSFLCWRAAVRDGRYYASLPTAKIATTAQGQVLIAGKVIPQENHPVIAAISGLESIWYRSYEVRFNDEKFFSFRTEQHEAVIPFLIDDGSGLCAVAPEDARFYIHDCFTDYRFDGPYGAFEVSIAPGQLLYAYGDFRTRDVVTNVNIEQEAKELLAKWKYDPATRKRFDLNEDGRLSQQELQLAQSAARRAIRQRNEYYLSDEYLRTAIRHRLTRDESGKPCIITDLSPGQIAQRCQKAAGLYLAAFFVSMPWLVYVVYQLLIHR